MSSSVLLEYYGNVALITLNRPENSNVLNKSMAHDLLSAARTCEQSSAVRAVVITGAGKNFCFGGDLRGMLSEIGSVKNYLLELTADLHAAILTFVCMPVPVIAAVNGAAAGAGVGFVAMSDLALCAESAKFSLAYTGVALTPDASTSFFLPILIGRKRAMDLLLNNRVLMAADALDWGLVNEVVADNKLLQHALSLAERLASGPRNSYAKTKKLLSMPHADLAVHLDLEREAISTQASSAEGLEGMRAFLKKRSPRYDI